MSAAPVVNTERQPPRLRLPTFADVYRDDLGFVWNALRRLGAQPSDVEDLAHEVFLVVHRRLVDFDPERPIRPWLFGICYRVLADHRRLARHRIETPDEGHPEEASTQAGPEKVAQQRQQQALVHQVLGHLDVDKRAVLIMHEMHGFAAPEIAHALGVPVNTVYSRLRVARAQFAATLSALQQGDPS